MLDTQGYLNTRPERLYVFYQDTSRVFGYSLDPGQATKIPDTRIFGVADINTWEFTFHDGTKMQLDDFDELHSYLIDIMERNRNKDVQISFGAMVEGKTVRSEKVEDWREQWAIMGEEVKRVFLGQGI